jgi:hypothetical protein
MKRIDFYMCACTKGLDEAVSEAVKLKVPGRKIGVWTNNLKREALLA